MFDKKIDVDRHVENCLKKTGNDTERNLRSFAFAKLYFGVGEFELARRYISNYLIVKPHSAEAQQLLGKIFEKLGKKEAALEAYRTSLDLDPKQNGLVLKVCELLAKDDVTMDPSRARYWCERAQLLDPQNPVVFSLRERLVSMESNNPDDIQQLYLSELETRPTDIALRVRLLQHLIDHNRILDAYKHVADIDQKNLSVFSNHLNWYETVAKILVRYRNENITNNSLTWEFWVLLISVLDKLVALSLDETNLFFKTPAECVTAIFNFDQTLLMAFENVDATCDEKQFGQEFMNHFRAQLCYHLAILAFKQAKKDQIKYKEAINLAIPLLLISYHYQPPNLNCVWLDHSTEAVRKRMQRWQREASFRCSQAGHVINVLAKERRSFADRVTQLTTGAWREKTFKSIFITRDQQSKMNSSYFVNCTHLKDFPVRLPDVEELLCCDEAAQFLHPDSLHHMIWIGLNNTSVNFRCSVFNGLQYSIKNLQNCAAETLNVLDIHAFLYCCIFCTQSQMEDSKHVINHNRDKPAVFPASITEPLGSLNQTKWFSSVYKMFKNECGSDLSDIRVTLIKGIEIVRCVGSHGLDVKLLVMLANTFAQRAKSLTKQSEIEYNEARAELYWRGALPLLEKLRANQAINYPSKRWFEYRYKEMPSSEINMNIEEGKLFSAIQLMKKKEHEKALRLLQTLTNPYASFYEAQTYKLLAEDKMSHNKESLTSEMRSQHIILLSRARDCLYLTLDRLREPSVDRKHPLNAELGTEIEKIERSLSRIDPDICTNRNECDGMSDENLSSAGSINDHTNLSSMYMTHSTYHNGNTTPRHDHNTTTTPYRNFELNVSRRVEARPSPERLDAQLRQMAAAKDATISHILEQNRMMLDSHRSLVEELRGFKEIVTKVTSTGEDLKGIKKFVEDLRDSIDDLSSLKDQVEEIKKDLSELKKDSTKLKGNQINEEDLYALEDDYNVDYNINAGASGFNAALYQNFPQRLQGANALAYSSLYGMYSMYPYGGLGLGQPGALPFSEGHLPDFRAMGSIAQGLSHTGLAQAQPAMPQPGIPQAAIPQPAIPQPIIPQPVIAQPAIPQPAIAQTVIPQPAQALSNMFTKLPADTNIYPKFDTAIPSMPSQFMVPPPQATLPSNFNPATQPNFTAISSTVTPVSKAPPVNVVITASDPLPTTSVTQPILSVIIPPQHLKGNAKPHNYQIPLPITTATFTAVSSLNTSPMPVSTQNLLSNVAPPIYSSLTVKPAQTKTVDSDRSLNDSENRNNISDISLDEHDPCPDFKPIIPLPDEVPVNTGEENEKVLFCERAKLFRFTDKEWRERGIGNIKILHNTETDKVRVLMRREQVHKICANHFLTTDIVLKPMQKSDKAFVWAANDYSDETMKSETLCVRFKSADEGKRFVEAFEQGKAIVSATEKDLLLPTVLPRADETEISLKDSQKDTPQKDSQVSLGGFKFVSTPTFKPKAAEVQEKQALLPASKSSPFASFSFESKDKSEIGSKIQTSEKPVQKEIVSPKVISKPESSQEGTDEFVPNIEFKPVIPLPELVVVKTGEENEEVLFESKAKLLRYDTTAKEWKERGIGIMKILKGKTIRLLMRWEQTHKICCNHQLLKNMKFTEMPKTNKILNWCAQDFSENELKTEMFAIRFRSQEQCEGFRKAIINAQSMLDENSCLPVLNIPKFESLQTIREDSDSHDGEHSPQKFKPSPAPTPPMDKLKQKSAGKWLCKTCYGHNDGKRNYCEACDSSKNDTVPQKDKSDNSQNFSFGVPSPNFGSPATPKTTSTSVTATSGWGDKFKPKAGSWSCKMCYVTNTESTLYCISCESPKDDTVPKKDNKGIDLSTGTEQKFSFGIPAPTSKPAEPIFGAKTQPVASFTFGVPQTVTASTGFTFGASKVAETPKNDKTNFGFNITKIADEPKTSLPLDLASKTFNFNLKPAEPEKKESFVFGSPNKHEFEFKPRSPRKQSGGDDEDSDESTGEDDGEHIYFKPVVPLPDKIEVRTGEENEQVLYCHRAKLFRFSSGEWKERGLGDIKVLKNSESEKIRVVMRREQVFKICLNHVLTPDMEYISKDERTWLFSAADYSDGEIDYHQFCIRFKNGDIAKDFMKAIESAQKQLPATEVDVNPQSKTEDDDLEIVFETKVTPEEEQKALSLQLPKNFYAYLQKEPCPGCIGCNDDNFVFETVKKPTEPAKVEQKSIFDAPKLPLFGSTIFGASTVSTAPQTTFTFQQPSTTFSFSTNSNNFSSSNGQFSFGLSTGKPFSFGSNLTSETVNKPATNIFSMQDTSKPTMFSEPFNSKNFSNSADQCDKKVETKSETVTLKDLVKETPEGEHRSPLQLGKSNFSTNLFGTSPNIFGNTDNKSIFQNKKSETPTTNVSFSGTSIFGAKTTIESFINKPSMFENVSTSVLAKNEEECNNPILKCDSTLSFSTLASTAKPLPAFGQSDETKPFMFEGTGSLIFSKFSSDSTKKTDKTIDTNKSTNEDEEGGAGDDEHHDPHFDPIVPLPAAVDTKTGEEEEEVLFIERAKLYRYNTDLREWKERGVGNIKILHHPIRDTYRLLMRREVIFKLVLNQLINIDLNLRPMHMSDSAWVWGGYNYSEDGDAFESLAVRFKSTELAHKFSTAVTKVLEKLNAKQEEEPADDCKDDEEYVSDEEENRTAEFSKRCSLSWQTEEGIWKDAGMGIMKVYYESEVCIGRIIMYNNNGEELSNTLIAADTIMRVEDTNCIWQATEFILEPPEVRTLKARFNSASAANELYYFYQEAVGYAQQNYMNLPNE